jgi:hypothetical protein
MVRRLEYTGYKDSGYVIDGLSSRDIDAIIRHFQQEVTGTVCFGSCISHVVFPTANIGLSEWPALCPREAGVLVKDERLRKAREYRFTNELSSEKFRVRLYATYLARVINEFHLLFN